MKTLKRTLSTLIVIQVALVACGCSALAADFEKVGQPDGAPDADTDTDSCNDQPISLQAVPPALVLVQDVSSGVAMNWPWVRDNLINFASMYDSTIQLGFDYHPVLDPGIGECVVWDHIRVDAALYTSGEINQTIESVSNPMGSPYLCGEMMNFLNVDYAPFFSSAPGEKYLVLISTGPDNCGVTNLECDGSATVFFQLASELRNQKDIQAIGVGLGVTALHMQVLNAISQTGGTVFTAAFDTTVSTFGEALTEIAESARIVCTYDLNDDFPDQNLISVYYNDIKLPRNDSCDLDEGWALSSDWGNPQIRLCPGTCNTFKLGGGGQITASYGCP